MTDLWTAEDVPAHLVFPGEPVPPLGQGLTRTVLSHRSRAAAGRAMGHYLMHLARMPHNKSDGLYPLLYGAADMFKTYGAARMPLPLTLRIGSRVYRIRRETTEDTP